MYISRQATNDSALLTPLSRGDRLARVYDIKRTGLVPTDYYAKIDGIFSGRHFPGQIAMGDFLGVIAVPM